MSVGRDVDTLGTALPRKAMPVCLPVIKYIVVAVSVAADRAVRISAKVRRILYAFYPAQSDVAYRYDSSAVFKTAVGAGARGIAQLVPEIG